jgi:hypothetical protein
VIAGETPSISHTETGTYTFTYSASLTTCAVVASVNESGRRFAQGQVTGLHVITVRTYNLEGLVDSNFSLMVACQ